LNDGRIDHEEAEMDAIVSCIESLRLKLESHRRAGLKEYPTRVIFIDPMLQVLGWDVTDPDEAVLEYTTIDGRSVDYALMLNRKPAAFVEAKPLDDALADVKSITQVVSYAANAGVDWCVLTNGVTYRVYRSTEKVRAPDKLLFEVSLDPKETEGLSTRQVAARFARLSRNAIAEGLLDEIGEQVFTTAKIRKALEKLFVDPPNSFVRLIRSRVGDDSVKPAQIRDALKRLWAQTAEVEIPRIREYVSKPTRKHKGKDYTEQHHTEGMPLEIVELYRVIDGFCRELEPGAVTKKYRKLYMAYSCGNNVFCCVRLQKSQIRAWLKLRFSDLEDPPHYSRDVSNIGHWGVGDVEITLDDMATLQDAKSLIRLSFEKNRASA
jgi:predicted transport protein